MVPTVRTDSTQADKRKGKSVQWQQAKLGLAHVQGSKELTYAATLLGSVEAAGRQLRACAKRAGFGKGHRVHGVGDGATWIAHQIKEHFGSQAATWWTSSTYAITSTLPPMPSNPRQRPGRNGCKRKRSGSKRRAWARCSTDCTPIWSPQTQPTSWPRCVAAIATSVRGCGHTTMLSLKFEGFSV